MTLSEYYNNLTTNAMWDYFGDNNIFFRHLRTYYIWIPHILSFPFVDINLWIIQIFLYWITYIKCIEASNLSWSFKCNLILRYMYRKWRYFRSKNVPALLSTRSSTPLERSEHFSFCSQTFNNTTPFEGGIGKGSASNRPDNTRSISPGWEYLSTSLA